MSHGSVHEEAEHAKHASHDPFDKRVAMTMVVVAALLAGVKIIGHRAHNDTLSYQIAANVEQTKTANKWNHYQAKKNRQYLYAALADNVAALGQKGGSPVFNPEDFDVFAAETHKEPKKEEKPKKKVELTEEDLQKVDALVKKGLNRDAAERVVTWRSQAARYEKETTELENEAHTLEKDTEHLQHRSEHQHHQAGYFDIGELFVELAVVLCSVAILVKHPGFWYGGMAVCAVGLVLVVCGFLAH